MFDATALVLVDIGATEVPPYVERLTSAFRAAGQPIIHVTRGGVASELLPATAPPLDGDLLRSGGVQTLGISEMAIGLPGAGAFDATPLDPVLRSLGVSGLVIGGVLPSPAVVQTVLEGEVRMLPTVLATEELAVVLAAQLTSTNHAA